MRFPSRFLLSNAVLASALTFTSLAAHAFVDVPNAAPVVDLTGTLSEQEQQALTNKIADIDSRTGTEVAMLMVPTTGEESVQSYSWRVAEAWKPGHEGVDRGLVVVIAKNDRKSYLQVGRGLDQVIPSEQATQLAKNMSPLFRKGKYYEGLDKNLDDVAALAATLPAPDDATAQPPQAALQAAPAQAAAPAPAAPADAILNAAGDPLDLIFKYGMPLVGLALLVQLLRWVMNSNSGGYSSTSISTHSTSVSRSTPNSGSNSGSGSGFATGFVVGAAIAESERRSSSYTSSSSSDYSSSSSSSSSSYSDSSSSSSSSSDSGGSFGGSGGGDSW